MANDKRENANQPVDRETLYQEIWAEPVSVVATRYGLSDVGLAKICRTLAIPLPSRGYWAKVKAGRIMAKPALPKLSQPTEISRRLVPLPPAQAAARAEAKTSVAKARKEDVTDLLNEAASSPPHPLVRATEKRLRRRDGWPADTLVRSAPKEVLNISVTHESISRAVGLADTLVKMLERQGFVIELDHERGTTLLRWTETGIALEFVLTEHIRRPRHEITPAEERAQKRYWNRSPWDRSAKYPDIPMYDYIPTGNLTIQVGSYPSKSWKDTPKTLLEQRIGEIVGGILGLARETYAKEQETIRRQTAHRLAVERFEFLKQRRANELERFKQLKVSAKYWQRAIQLRAFADAAEASAKLKGELSSEQMEWLAWVRAKADWLDPLIQVSDPILDAPEPKLPSYWEFRTTP